MTETKKVIDIEDVRDEEVNTEETKKGFFSKVLKHKDTIVMVVAMIAAGKYGYTLGKSAGMKVVATAVIDNTPEVIDAASEVIEDVIA